MKYSDFCKKLDLLPIRKKLEKKLTPKELTEGERHYRMFLYLISKYQSTPIVPTELIDEFWHAHILDTIKYADDCAKLFGRFIHHFPYLGLRGKDDVVKVQQQFEASMQLFEKEFGINPSKMIELGALSICSGGCGGRGKITIMEKTSGLDLHTRPM